MLVEMEKKKHGKPISPAIALKLKNKKLKKELRIKPTIKTKKVYPYLILEAKLYKEDYCKAIFKENHIELECSIDSSGNIFKLPYKEIEKHMR